MRNLAILVGVPVVLWGLLLYPGWLFVGDDVWRHSSTALALCLIPAVATYVGIQRFATTADGRMLGTLASSGVRMTVALGVGCALYTKLPNLYSGGFLYWLLVFYSVILGLEVGLLVRQTPTEAESGSK